MVALSVFSAALHDELYVLAMDVCPDGAIFVIVTLIGQILVLHKTPILQVCCTKHHILG